MNNHIACRGLFLLCLAAAAQSLCAADKTYRRHRRNPVIFTDDYFGRKVSDPYRWMEDSKSPEFKFWMKAQAGYASANLDRLKTTRSITDVARRTEQREC